MFHLRPFLKVRSGATGRIKCAALPLLLATGLLLTSCAETKYVMQLEPAAGPAAVQATQGGERVWPSPPETPRFRYAGMLIGEENFVPDERGDKRSVSEKFLRWLVGLAGNNTPKIELRRPQTGMVDSDGRVYVTDISNHAVFVFDQVAGKLHVWTEAQERRNFVTPVGIVEGANGQVLVADAELGQVFRFDRDGKPLGSFGKGILVRPTGLARDVQRGRIYVADTHAHDVKVFDDEGRLVDMIGRRGEDEGDLNYPTHLAFARDQLYVVDGMNARVQIYDSEGRNAGGFGRRGLFIGNMTRPKGITVDAEGNIYVVESFYDNLLVFNSEGKFLMPIGGTGKDIGQFYLPAGVWTDRQNRIYVADMFNGRIVIFQFLGGA